MFKPKLEYQLTFEGLWPSAAAHLGGRRIVEENQSGEIYVWELPETPPEFKAPSSSGEVKLTAPNVPPKFKLLGHTNAISKLIWDASRKRIVSASLDRTVRFWSLEGAPSGKEDAILDSESREREFKRNKKEEVLKAPGVPVETFTATKTLEGHPDWIHTLAISGDGKRLISGDASSNVIVWDAETGAVVSKWKGRSWNWIVAAALSPDGASALVSEYRYKRDDFDIPAAAFRIFNVADGSEKLDILKVQFPKLNPDDNSYGGGQLWRKFIHHGLVAVAISPNGKLLAAAQGGETDTGKIHLIEAETGKALREVSGHQYGATDVLFSADGKYVYSAGRDTTVRICQTEDGKEVAALGASRGGQFKDWIAAISVNPGETHLAAADIAGHVAVWKLRE